MKSLIASFRSVPVAVFRVAVCPMVLGVVLITGVGLAIPQPAQSQKPPIAKDRFINVQNSSYPEEGNFLTPKRSWQVKGSDSQSKKTSANFNSQFYGN